MSFLSKILGHDVERDPWDIVATYEDGSFSTASVWAHDRKELFTLTEAWIPVNPNSEMVSLSCTRRERKK